MTERAFEVDNVIVRNQILTERLKLVPIDLEHADDLWALHQEPLVAEYWGEWTKADAIGHATEFGDGWKAKGVHKWLAYDRTTSEIVGRGGLSRAIVDGSEELEDGWTVSGKFRGKGYATEIGQAGLDFAFEHLGADEVVSFTETTNASSIAVMKRLGMRYVKDIVHDGEPFVLYKLTRALRHV